MCFLSTLRRRNLKTQQLLVILDLCLSETPAVKYHPYRVVIVYKMFSIHTKTNRRGVKFFQFEERFRKAQFSWRISVNGRPSR